VEDQVAELAELRRRAYSRVGTEEDRRRLAELESSLAVLPATPAETVVEPADLPVTPVEREDVTPPAPVRLSRWMATGAGALVGAAIATAVTLAVVASNGPVDEPEPASALAVFERDALGIDDPSNLLFPIDDLLRDAEGSILDEVEDLTLRWVGSPSGHDVYAVRWHVGDAYTICLIVEGTDQAGAACTSEIDFVTHGIRISSAGLDVKWGPSGTEVWVTSVG
jgi:hypothetical protein